MPKTDYDQYMKLKEALQVLITSGTDDSPEGDIIRDQMDEPWFNMTEDEQNETRKHTDT